MHREINQKAEDGAEGQEGTVVSPNLSHVKGSMIWCLNSLGKRAKAILLHFSKGEIYEKWLLIYAKKQSVTHS